MKEMLGGFAFLLLLAAQVFAVAALYGRADRTGATGESAARPDIARVDAPYPFDRYADQCRTRRAHYIAALFRSAKS